MSSLAALFGQAPTVEELQSQVSLDSLILTEQFYFFTVVIMWLIHVGFMAYEAGAARRKNIMSTAMKNILTIAVVTPTFYYFGWYIYGCFEQGLPWIGPDSLDGHAGLVKSAGNDVWSLTAQANGMAVDKHSYRYAVGATGQWQRNLSTREQMTGYLQYSDLRYQSYQGADQSIRDAHRWVVGGAYARVFEGGWIGYAGGYLGVENEKERDGSHDDLPSIDGSCEFTEPVHLVRGERLCAAERFGDEEHLSGLLHLLHSIISVP